MAVWRRRCNSLATRTCPQAGCSISGAARFLSTGLRREISASAASAPLVV
jgi:hypothetical protein